MSPAATSLPQYALDFFKIESLAFGCTKAGSQTPANCTVSIVGMCSGPGSGSTQNVTAWTWKDEFVVAKGQKVKGLQMWDLGTYGEQYLCLNFTVKSVGEESHGGKGPVVWVDQVRVVEYTESALFP
jgi:hypothetical protein